MIEKPEIYFSGFFIFDCQLIIYTMKKLLLLFATILLFGCSSDDSETEIITETIEVCPEPKEGIVIYTVNSQADQIFITYTGENNERLTAFSETNTWSYSFNSKAGDIALVEVFHNQNQILTNISISINGLELDSVGCSSSGAATCLSFSKIPETFPDN